MGGAWSHVFRQTELWRQSLQVVVEVYPLTMTRSKEQWRLCDHENMLQLLEWEQGTGQGCYAEQELQAVYRQCLQDLLGGYRTWVGGNIREVFLDPILALLHAMYVAQCPMTLQDCNQADIRQRHSGGKQKHRDEEDAINLRVERIVLESTEDPTGLKQSWQSIIQVVYGHLQKLRQDPEKGALFAKVLRALSALIQYQPGEPAGRDCRHTMMQSVLYRCLCSSMDAVFARVAWCGW